MLNLSKFIQNTYAVAASNKPHLPVLRILVSNFV